MKIPLGGEGHSHLLKRTSKIQIYLQVVEHKKQNLLKQIWKKYIFSTEGFLWGVYWCCQIFPRTVPSNITTSCHPNSLQVCLSRVSLFFPPSDPNSCHNSILKIRLFITQNNFQHGELPIQIFSHIYYTSYLICMKST